VTADRPGEQQGDLPVDLSDDDALLGVLRLAMEGVDEPPPSVMEAAMRAFTWDTAYRELLETAFDSASIASGMRSAGTVEERDLTFEAAGITLEVTVERHGSTVTVSGVVHPVVASVRVLAPGCDEQLVACDEHGRFACEVNATAVAVAVEGPDGIVRRSELIRT